MSYAKTQREALRQKGQFWTPDWLADAMVAYVLERDDQVLFDPAVGAGAFFLAAKRLALKNAWSVRFAGKEIDSYTLAEARRSGLTEAELATVSIGDFLSEPPEQQFEAIIANPPYIRHHRLSAETKAHLRRLALEHLGFALDGRLGLHNYFLLVALRLLAPDGKLAFVMPADTCEGLSAKRFWTWITTHYCLEAVIAFHHSISPFPTVDINPLIFLIRNSAPQKNFWWAYCIAQPENLPTWIASRFEKSVNGLNLHQRAVAEAVETGLSRSTTQRSHPDSVPFSHFFTVKRGIATGANNFFFLTHEQVRQLELPESFFKLAIGRTRDVVGNVLDEQAIAALRARKRPSLLLQLDGSPLESFPEALQRYLKLGEALQIHRRPLLAQRSPWYKMEVRQPPPFLFAYLGRRNTRFILNSAQAVPLSSFLCVYPRPEFEQAIAQLWLLLQRSELLEGLASVGKSYGSGAIKVEPRALALLRIPAKLVEALELSTARQMSLF